MKQEPMWNQGYQEAKSNKSPWFKSKENPFLRAEDNTEKVFDVDDEEEEESDEHFEYDCDDDSENAPKFENILQATNSYLILTLW